MIAAQFARLFRSTSSSLMWLSWIQIVTLWVRLCTGPCERAKLCTDVRNSMSADQHDWLNCALADLRVAQLLEGDVDVPDRIVCFHAQQAAEKALKAALVATGTPFRKTHDVVVLAGLTAAELVLHLQTIDLAVL